MKTFTLKELIQSKDAEVSRQAKALLNINFLESTQFEIVLKQKIIY